MSIEILMLLGPKLGDPQVGLEPSKTQQKTAQAQRPKKKEEK